MFIVGLTGGIGSGKTQVTHCFESLGVTVIDTDKIARDVVMPHTPALKKISAHFGNDILHQDGSLNRQALREHIFDHPQERHWLENLLHPLIRAEVQHQVSQVSSPYCMIVVPLLLESNDDPYKTYHLNRIIVVDTDEKNQLARATERDNTTQAHIKKIMAQQVSREQRRLAADDIIENNSSLGDLSTKVKLLHEYYLTLAN